MGYSPRSGAVILGLKRVGCKRREETDHQNNIGVQLRGENLKPSMKTQCIADTESAVQAKYTSATKPRLHA